jgi:hypothetical protein
LVRRSANGILGEVTPPAPADPKKAFNVRTRVHEYGGGAYVVADGMVCFANDNDRHLYLQVPGAAPVAITADTQLRFADGIIDRARSRMIWVREDHTENNLQPANSLVEVQPGRFKAAARTCVRERLLFIAKIEPRRRATCVAGVASSQYALDGH